MKTKYKLIQVNGTITEGSVDWPKAPDFGQIRALVEPLIQTEGQPYAYLEHVRVWEVGSYVSMFVDDMGSLKKLPINETATEAYWGREKEYDPSADSSDWPKIHGPAVLFSRNVWF